MTTNMILQTATETAELTTTEAAVAGAFLTALAMVFVARWYYSDAPAPMLECWDCGRFVDTNAYCGGCGAELDYGRVEEYDGDGAGDPLPERLGQLRERVRDGLPRLRSEPEESEETAEEEDSTRVEVAPKHLRGEREEAEA